MDGSIKKRRFGGFIIVRFAQLSRRVAVHIVCTSLLFGCQPKAEDQPAAKAPAKPQTIPRVTAPSANRYVVHRVTDGDTFKANAADGKRVKVRVKGIDCPESHPNAKCRSMGAKGKMGCDEQVPLGKAATKLARELLVGSVELESPDDFFELDAFGRVLAYVRLADGRDFGAVMVKEGGCSDFGWKYPHPRSDRYKKLEGSR